MHLHMRAKCRWMRNLCGLVHTRAAATTSVTSVHTTPLLPEVSSASAPDAHTDAFPFELTCPICQVTNFSVGRTGRRCGLQL